MGRRLDAWREIASNAGYDGDPLMSTVDAINATVNALGGEGTAQGIADAVTNLAPFIGGGGENVEFFVIGPNALAGTFTIGGHPVTLEDFSGGEFTGKKASVPNGSVVLFTPTQGATTNVANVTWWADAQDFYDDGTFIGTADVGPILDGYAFVIAGVTSFYSSSA